MTNRAEGSKYDDMLKEDLEKEAKERNLEVKRRDGGDGEPTKGDFIEALINADGTARTTGDVQRIGEGDDGLVATRGKSVTAGLRDKPRVLSEKDRTKLATEKAKNSIRVRATRTGEYPAGHLRSQDEEFDYELTEADRESKSIPSWLEQVEGKKGQAKGDFERRPVPAELSGVAGPRVETDEE